VATGLWRSTAKKSRKVSKFPIVQQAGVGALLPKGVPEGRMVRSWLDSWSGVGHVVDGSASVWSTAERGPLSATRDLGHRSGGRGWWLRVFSSFLRAYGLAAGNMMVSFPVSISITSSAALTFDDELTTRHKA